MALNQSKGLVRGELKVVEIRLFKRWSTARNLRGWDLSQTFSFEKKREVPLSDVPQLDQLAWVWPVRGQPLWRSPRRTSHPAGEKKLSHTPEIFRVLGRSWIWSNRALWTGTAWWRSIRWPRGYSASMRWKFEDNHQNRFFPHHCTCLLFLILEIWGVKWCSSSDARKLQLRDHPWQANGIQPCGHRRFFASFILSSTSFLL